MGKRKHLEESYSQCDYTCYPLDVEEVKRYLPLWKNGKVVKTGTYLTWEAVVSHTLYMKARNIKPSAMGDHQWDPEKSLQLVHEAAGRGVLPGPDYSELTQFKEKGLNYGSYIHECEKRRTPICTIAINIMGETCTANHHLLVPDTEGSYKSAAASFFTGKPYNIIKPTKKIKGLPKFKELVVMTLVDNDQPLNKKAKQLFRMNLYGPVLIACNNREENGLLEFTMEQYKHAFDLNPTAPKKKIVEADPMGLNEYKEVAKDLKRQLDDVADPSKNKCLKVAPPALQRSQAIGVGA